MKKSVSLVQILLLTIVLATPVVIAILQLTQTFPTIPAQSGTLPSIQTQAATGVTNNSAILHGAVTSIGGYSHANVSFQWSLYSNMSSSTMTPSQTKNGTGSFSFALGGVLGPSLQYYFRAAGYFYNSTTNTTIYGTVLTFTTGDNLVLPTDWIIVLFVVLVAFCTILGFKFHPIAFLFDGLILIMFGLFIFLYLDPSDTIDITIKVFFLVMFMGLGLFVMFLGMMNVSNKR